MRRHRKSYIQFTIAALLCLLIYRSMFSISKKTKAQVEFEMEGLNREKANQNNSELVQLIRKTQAQVEFEMEELNRGKANQDDSDLVQLVRDYYLFPPSAEPYNLETNERSSKDGQGQLELLAPILKKITPGSFIECGAFDGEYLSNTLWLEKELGWTGLLIEADPKSYAKLQTKNRKAHQSNTCLSRFQYPEKLSFQRHPLYPVLTSNRQFDEITAAKARTKFGAEAQAEFQCIPLYTIFLALGKLKWDFFSLDTEGSELEILKTIPFDKVFFKIMTIEANLIPEGSAELDSFMSSKGYKFYEAVHVDRVYVHEAVWNDLVGA